MKRLNNGRKLRIVLDTNCYVNVLLSKESASAKIFRSVVNGEIHNFYTIQVMNEIEAVFSSHPEFDLTNEETDNFFSIIKDCSFQVEQSPEFNVKKCRDPTDDKFLSLAKQVEADFIITLDNDLLALKDIGRTKILTPRDYLFLVL